MVGRLPETTFRVKSLGCPIGGRPQDWVVVNLSLGMLGFHTHLLQKLEIFKIDSYTFPPWNQAETFGRAPPKKKKKEKNTATAQIH